LGQNFWWAGRRQLVKLLAPGAAPIADVALCRLSLAGDASNVALDMAHHQRSQVIGFVGISVNDGHIGMTLAGFSDFAWDVLCVVRGPA
jgi:hypothetical protein